MDPKLDALVSMLLSHELRKKSSDSSGMLSVLGEGLRKGDLKEIRKGLRTNPRASLRLLVKRIELSVGTAVKGDM